MTSRSRSTLGQAGTIADYAYDPLNRLASVASGGQTTSYAYDVASNLTQTTLPSGNGYVETRAYDRAGRLIDVESKKGAATLSRFAIALDPVGNPMQIVRSGSLAQTQAYSYDANDRLAGVCFQAGTCPGASDPFIRWTYDKVGNRLNEQRPGAPTTTYTYDFRDRLLSAGSISYTYDQNGNELSAGTRTFTYDLANRLKTTTQGSTTTTYLYDGDSVRLQASTGSQANKKTNFLWDVSFGLPQIALERDGNNALLRRYTYGQQRLSMTAGSNTSYFIHDGLGSTANLTSSTGATQWTWSYEPFGSIRTETKASGSQPANFMKFTGEYLDPTGLYHLRARQYDPGVGRFLRPDPAGQLSNDMAISAYAYVANRPAVLVDPSGETFVPSDRALEMTVLASSRVAFTQGASGADTAVVARPSKLIYSARVLLLMASTIDVFHAFPRWIDIQVVRTGTIRKTASRDPNAAPYVEYNRPGTIGVRVGPVSRGKNGCFEIGGEPKSRGSVLFVKHRFFNWRRPDC